MTTATTTAVTTDSYPAVGRGPLQRLRARLGAKGSIVLLLLPVWLFGALHFGPRAGLVVAASVAVCVAASVVPRISAGQPWQLLNPGTVITGILLGLTLGPQTPMYMIVVGGLVAEIVGKAPFFGLGHPLFNPAALGRAAIALLEVLDPPARAELGSGASPLMVTAGGNPPPDYLWELMLGFSKGAIGETNALLLLLVGSAVLLRVVIKRHAAIAMLLGAPILVAFMPSTADIQGHAPWVHHPLVYLAGGSTLLMALFFATDPMTTPQTRVGGVLFGLGAAAIGVTGRLYTTIPGCEMWGVLVMNAATPALNRLTGAARKATTSSPPSGRRLAVLDAAAEDASVASFYAKQPLDTTESPFAEAQDSAPWRTTPSRRFTGSSGTRFDVLRHWHQRSAPEALLSLIDRRGLRGRGGAGYPASDKWRAARAHAGPRVVVINGQEGEPDTFKDRYLMERHPHTVVEGGLLAALAVDAGEVHFVVKADYHESRAALAAALDDAHQALPGLGVRTRLVAGPSLYVCGEETALLQFLESRRGEPRTRPPFPTESGLWGQPTVVHNVETAAWLPSTACTEADDSVQRRDRLASISGGVQVPGVYVVRPETTLRQAISMAGGTPEDLEPKALVVGGPGGGLLPPSLLDLPMERSALRREGASLGTASVRVLEEGVCLMSEVVRAVSFLASESCGRCTPCRAGGAELSRLITSLADGTRDAGSMAELDGLCHALVAGSACGLGSSLPGMLKSLQQHWPEILQAHVDGVPCPCCNLATHGSKECRAQYNPTQHR